MGNFEEEEYSESVLVGQYTSIEQKWMFDGLIFSNLPYWEMVSQWSGFDPNSTRDDFNLSRRECQQEDA